MFLQSDNHNHQGADLEDEEGQEEEEWDSVDSLDTDTEESNVCPLLARTGLRSYLTDNCDIAEMIGVNTERGEAAGDISEEEDSDDTQDMSDNKVGWSELLPINWNHVRSFQTIYSESMKPWVETETDVEIERERVVLLLTWKIFKYLC